MGRGIDLMKDNKTERDSGTKQDRTDRTDQADLVERTETMQWTQEDPADPQTMSRAAFAEAHLRDGRGRPWRVREYQRDSLCSVSDRKVHCDGRDVGKTTEIELVTAWAAFALGGQEMLIAAPTENHLFPLMARLARRFEARADPMPELMEVRRSPSWYFRFANGFQLWGRIAGPRGVNFQGMHVDWQIVDEAQEMPETGWGELYQALNGGGRRWVYGVPNGLRNTFYRMTRMAGVEQFNWPSSVNPEFTPAKAEELAQLYGGPRSPGFIHRVLGEHGEPMYAVFSLDDYQACVDPALPHADVVLREGEGFSAPADIAPGVYYLGCDLGYARDPSEYVVYRSAPPHLINVLRLRLDGVNYARQQAVIEELDAAYAFQGIGIDCGNSGRAVAHQLLALGADWPRKLRAFEFGGVVPLQRLPEGEQLRRRTKEFMTELLQRGMSDRTLVFPPVADRETQYASHTYAVNATGHIVYEKGNDHLIDADRCAVLRHYLDTLEDTSIGRDVGVALTFF
jgi:hypothetical protein